MATIRVETTITAALAGAMPGDVVEIPGGVYKERAIIRTDGVILRGLDGAILDGGYSHAAAKVAGNTWRDLRYKSPGSGAKGEPAMITVAADGVTVENLTVRNSPGSGVAAGAVSGLTVRGCAFDHLYGSGIKVNGTGGTARKIVIEDNSVNAASVRIFDPTRDISNDPMDVSGSIKVGNAADVVIRGNVVTNGFGEGINMGKDLVGFVCEGNTVSDCNHKHFYCNSAVDGVIRNNLAYCSGDPAHLWIDNEAPAGLAVKDETTRKPYSADIVFENNVVVNCGIPVEVNPNGDGAVTVRRNTFVWGPQTRRGPWLSGGAVTVEGNIFAMLPGVMPMGKPTTVGPNLWSIQPPGAWQAAGDVVGDPGFVAPGLPAREFDPFGLTAADAFNLDGYAPGPGSPAVAEGVVRFGALQPPVVEPPPDVDPPPVEPEPEPPTGWRQLLTANQRGLLKQARRAVREGTAKAQDKLINAMAVILDGKEKQDDE